MPFLKAGKTQKKVIFQQLTAEFSCEFCLRNYTDGVFGRTAAQTREHTLGKTGILFKGQDRKG